MSGTVDLTTAGSSGSIGGAIFTTDTTHSAGTGGFNTFVQVQRNGTEQGYNTDANPQFDEKNGHTHNHALLLADVPIFFGDGTGGTEEGVAYREFKLDINEAGGAKRLLSLDKLQIWQEEAGNLTNFNTGGTGFAGAHTNHLVYNMDAAGDNWVALNSGLSSGSGGGDMRLLIRNDLFINDAAHRYVYLYSMFGQQSGQWASDGGFEEWGTATPTGGSSGGAVLHLDKTYSVGGGTADTVGEVITYTYKVSNFGSVALTGITVTDPSVGDLAPVTSGGFNVGDTDHDNQLDTTEAWTYTAHHTVTQLDIDSNGGGDGSIDNTATADSNQTAPVIASASVPIDRKPHVTITKTATIPDVTTANDPTPGDGKIDSPADDISYTITVVNDGNTTLNEVQMNDTLLGMLTVHTETGGTGVNGDGILNVGETWTYTASYNVQQSDIDNRGSVDGTADNNIHNEATVSSLEILGATASANVAIDYRPHLAIAKTATIPDVTTANDPTPNDGKIDSPADDITYTITVVNDGNVTLNTVQLNDTLLGTLTTHTETGGTGVNGDNVLDVGETWTYTALYDVQQSDIDNGGSVDGERDNNIHNAATVSTAEGAGGTASADVAIDYRATVTLVKDGTFADDNNDGYSEVGEHINYTFTINNTGNVTLTDVAVSDEEVTVSGTPIASLAPGASDNTTWTASYAITQSDIDAGFYENTATVGANEASASSGTEHVDLPPPPPANPLAFTKTGTELHDSDESGGPSVADTIQYFFTVMNNGMTSLHGVQLHDTLFGTIAFVPNTDPNSNGLLDPGETWDRDLTYITNGDDIGAGFVDNSAFVTGLDPSNVVVTSNTATWHVEF